MASLSIREIMNADIIQCELCEKRFYGMTAFVGHPCRDDKLDEGVESRTAPTEDSTTDSMPSTSKSSEETQPIFWNVPATKILLAEIKKRDDATQKGKNTKKKMWLCIAEELASNGYKFTWEQVMGKWKTLITALKITRDHNNRSGADKKSCAFQEELEEILGGNPTIEPSTTSGLNLMDLHDEIFVKIMQLIPVCELLRNVSKVCVRFWTIIRQHPSLYSNVAFEDSFHIDEHVLLLVTTFPQKLKVLELGGQVYTVGVERFNHIMYGLVNASNLTVLDFTECPLSDISFLKYLLSLEVLNLSSTKINDKQLENIKPLSKLTYLYLSFTQVMMSSILDTLRNLSLEYLDACGIMCTYDEFLTALTFCPTLMGAHLSFELASHYQNACNFIDTYYEGKIELRAYWLF